MQNKALLLVAVALMLIAGIAFAEDLNQDTNTNQIPCITEGKTMPVYPGYACCSGLGPIPTTATSSDGIVQPLIGASICSKCGNGTCEQWENYANCPADCAKPTCTDSDGLNYFVKGVVKGVNPYDNQVHAIEDTCSLNGGLAGSCTAGTDCKVLEGDCNGIYFSIKPHPCPNGCSNGACLSGTDTNQVVCTEEYAPVCAQIMITPPCVSTAATCPPVAVQKTYTNSCFASLAGAKILYKGECTSTTQQKCGVLQYSVLDSCTTVDSNLTFKGFVGAKWTCQDGTTFSEGGVAGKCFTPEYLQGLAKAKCENKCTPVPPTTMCGGIAGKSCPAGYTCELEGNYPDAGGKCVPLGSNCPQYVQPGPDFCPNGTITAAIDSTGCKKPVCTPAMGDFYKSAYWSCSNGKEFTYTNQGCTPYATWKEKARNACAQFSTDCTSSSSTVQTATSTASGGASATVANTISPATGNIIATTATARTTATSTIAPAPSPTNATAIAPVPAANTVPTDCIGGEVTVSVFKVSDQCRPDCKEYTDAQGCTVVSCQNGQQTTSCPVSGTNTTCYTQSWDEIRSIKENCPAQGGQVVINFDNNCNKYVCLSQATPATADTNAGCTTADKIPQEKIDYCNKNGGKFITKTNDNGCIVMADCVGATFSNNSNSPINKKILTDKTSLLSLAVMLESLRIDLQKTQVKIQAIADYYSSQGDTNAAARFNKAAGLIGQAISGVDDSKKKIRDNIDTFGEADALMVRNNIQDIRDTTLTQALLAMLE